ncbi:MAG TPA: aminoglycoside phosphotransferase family protein [Clostridia bacterium]|nr:aminoglycoside phosphotransferase family protein [Clostridia bacterium]
MHKGKLVGKGKTAEVYEWGNDKVLKLYFKRYGYERAIYEAEIGNKIHASGLPSPDVFDIIDVNGRVGLILERIRGKSVLEQVKFNPWEMLTYAKKIARLHYGIHQFCNDGLPGQKERLTLKIERSEKILGQDKTKRIINYLDTLPDSNIVCHGDLHFHNIIISSSTLVPIDWANAYKGSPFGDIARTCLLMNTPILSSKSGKLVSNHQDPRWLAHKIYLKEYLQLSEARHEDIDAWILPVAAAKLKDKVTAEQKALINIINERLRLIN